MLANAFVDNAKVMAKGQITIPKDVREVLGVASGDRVSFIVEGGTVRIVNSAVYAMQMLQEEMSGEAEVSGVTSDDDVMALVKELRNEADIQQKIPQTSGGIGQISFNSLTDAGISTHPDRRKHVGITGQGCR